MGLWGTKSVGILTNLSKQESPEPGDGEGCGSARGADACPAPVQGAQTTVPFPGLPVQLDRCSFPNPSPFSLPSKEILSPVKAGFSPASH